MILTLSVVAPQPNKISKHLRMKVGSNHLNVAQSAMLFPNADGDVRLLSKANQSSKDITELKHLFMASTKKIELLCEMITK
ncbi:hypothetical protein POTOM_000596 [Populus tomentosa]|uniref:Uncharacterized protein n=1 Tax=Populus tomentosa TaxID=118781 RepID=A0A8X8DGD4_POPTO|nr:hypothetical protein POTOM_000596 [Populus tomentosa]